MSRASTCPASDLNGRSTAPAGTAGASHKKAKPAKAAWRSARPDDQKLLLTINETAFVLNIAPNKIYQMARTGELPSLKIGASRRILRTALVSYLQSLQTLAS